MLHEPPLIPQALTRDAELMPYDSIEFPEAELTINGEKVPVKNLKLKLTPEYAKTLAGSFISKAGITSGTFALRGRAIGADRITMPIKSKTNDYLCPDCLAIVHDESGVPECTGWPKAMQHARRFMEPFGGEI